VTPAKPRLRAVATGARNDERAAEARPVADAEPRDGLTWLVKKKRLNRLEQWESYRFRAGFREDGDGVLGSPSCLEFSTGGTGGGSGVQAALVAITDARREYLYIVGHVLRGVDDLRTVMDGVCGRGYTLRQLAGGNQLRQAMLENSLHIALALIMAWRADMKARAAEVANNGA
jgi:hypothetical protein